MATPAPAPDPKRNKNLVEPDVEDQSVEPPAPEPGNQSGQRSRPPQPIREPKPEKPTPAKEPTPKEAPTPPKPGTSAGAPAQPPANKPPVDTDAIGEPLPETLPEQSEDRDDNQPDPRDFKEKEPSEPDHDREDGKDKKSEGSKSEGKSKGSKAKGPEGGASPKPTGASAGGSLGVGTSGSGAAAEGAAEAAGKVAAQTAVRAALSNPYVLAGVLAFILIFGGILAFIVPAGMAGTRSGGGAGNSQSQQAGGGAAVSGNVQQLARQILQSNKITVEGNPRSSLQAAAEGKCSPTPSTGGCVKLDPRLLKALLEVSQKRPFTITSLTTGDHTSCSNHYEGRAADIVPADSSLLAEFRKYGATELLGPGDPGHDDHIHVAWDGPNKNCE